MANKNTIKVNRVMPELIEYANAADKTINEVVNEILEDAMLHFIKGKVAQINKEMKQ